MARNPWIRSALGVFALLALTSSIPYLRATLLPPQGTRFVGVFYAIPDVYNYFAYMQQAEDGFFLFTDKLSLDSSGPRMVNLEWWAVGRLAALSGLGLPEAFRLLGLFSSFFLVLGVARWLRWAGMPASHSLGALVLVFFGGGVGGLLFLSLGPPAWRFSDLTSGLFPIISALVNSHFVAGTALLVWSFLGLSRGGRATLAALLAGNVLGLSRPYDLVLLVGIRIGSVALSLPPSQWIRSLLPLVGLTPSIVINYWIFFRSQAFQGFKHSSPDFAAFFLAIGPALALAALGVRRVSSSQGPARIYNAALLSWAFIVIAGVPLLAGLFSFMSQSAVNVGVPLLAVGALGLSRRSPRALLLVAVAFCSTGLVAFKVLLEDNPSWFVPRERIEVAKALHPLCRPGEIVMAPPVIGMYANAYSSCRAFITHIIGPDSPIRQEEMMGFYLDGGPEARRALLERRCVSHLVLPDQVDGHAWAFLAPDFQRTTRVGHRPHGFVVYSRAAPSDCDADR